MEYLNNIGRSPSTSGGDFFRGIGSGLMGLVENKTKEIQRQKEMDLYQRSGFTPQASELLTHIREVDPSHFNNILQSLGQGAYQQAPQQQQEFAPQEYAPSERVEISEGPKGISEKVSIEKGAPLFEDKEAKKRAHEEQKIINKEVYPYIKEVQNKAKSAKENDLRLNRMEKLIDSRKLNAPLFAAGLKALKLGGYGVDLGSLLSAESQEFEKLSNDFIKTAKDIFGNRLTDQDLKAFLSTVPTVTQSDNAKRAVIHNLRLMNKGSELREKATRQLLKKYNNRPPLDFEAQVEDFIKPELDKIAQKFEEGTFKSGREYKYFNPEE